MFFVKNVPPWERFTRLLVAAIVAALVVFVVAPWSYLVGAGAAFLAVTAFVGYCPMCAMIDRRQPRT